MTEYKSGFISSVINRSEKILKSGKSENYDVTQLLLLVSFGFAMVSERLKFNEESRDQFVSEEASNEKKFKKSLKKSFCSDPLQINNKKFFDNFRKNNDWELKKIEGAEGKYEINDILEKTRNKSEDVKREDLKYAELIRCLRNSFGHGGIHPLSENQRSPNKKDDLKLFSLGKDVREKINQIYFVSRWTDGSGKYLGRYILIMSVESLHVFWKDWRNLLLQDETNSFADLDYAA